MPTAATTSQERRGIGDVRWFMESVVVASARRRWSIDPAADASFQLGPRPPQLGLQLFLPQPAVEQLPRRFQGHNVRRVPFAVGGFGAADGGLDLGTDFVVETIRSSVELAV